MDCVKNISTQEQNYKKPGIGAVIGGIVAGSTVCDLTNKPTKILSPQDYKQNKKY